MTISNESYNKFKKIEFFGAFILFFCIPFFKVGKTIGILMLIFGSFTHLIYQKKYHLRKPTIIEIFLIGMLLAGFISTLLNWPFPKKFNGFKDTLQFVLIFWILAQNNFSLKKIEMLFWAIVAGSVIGLIWGYIRMKTGETTFFIFKNMSIANTAIIIGIITSSLVGKLFERKQLFKKGKIVSIASIIFLIICLFIGGNRSGVVGLTAFLLIIPFCIKINYKSIIVFLIVVSLSSLFIWNTKSYSNRISHLLEMNVNFLDYDNMTINDKVRFNYWRVSYAQFTQKNKKIFGIGPRNHRSINSEELRFDPPLIKTHLKQLRHPNHSHNWIFTKLIEEGLFGLFWILGFWVLILWRLFKYRRNDAYFHWSFIACLGAIVIPATAGLFYSPFRREVAWVSMMYIGIAFSIFGRVDNKEISLDR